MFPTKKELKRLKKAWKAFAKAHPLTAAELVPFHKQRLTSFPTPRAWDGLPGIGKSQIAPLIMLDEFNANAGALPNVLRICTGTQSKDKSKVKGLVKV